MCPAADDCDSDGDGDMLCPLWRQMALQDPTSYLLYMYEYKIPPPDRDMYHSRGRVSTSLT
jgi:hypothetical protein